MAEAGGLWVSRKRSQYIGNVGESRVATTFVELGWGVPVKPTEDVGDDLIAFAHVDDLGHLGLPVAIQVKTRGLLHG